MSDLRLHSFRRCPFAIRVRVTLAEKGLDYEVIEEDLGNPSAELKRLNPEERVPVLIHSGQALRESAVITEYLDDAFPSPPLRPSGALERARMRLWTHWCDSLLKPDLDLFKYEWTQLAEPDQINCLGRLRARLDELEAALAGGRTFLLGQSITLADIHVFPFYRQLTRARPDFTALVFPPLARDWLKRMTDRPSFVHAMRTELR